MRPGTCEKVESFLMKKMMADQGKGTGRYERRKTFRFLKNETLTRMGDQYQLSTILRYNPISSKPGHVN